MKSEHEKEPFYLMEHPEEGERLRVKSGRESTIAQLRLTGIDQVPEGARVVDAGSGIGFVASCMAEAMGQKPHTLSLLDQSEIRLKEATDLLLEYTVPEKEMIQCNLDALPLGNQSSDYVFCRFVFEYLQDQQKVFSELARITKPGGKLVVGDLDMNCMIHYPMDPVHEKKLNEIADVLHRSKMLDPYAGRRLYSYFYDSNEFKDIRVHMMPHHLFYGKMEDAQLLNWERKLCQLAAKQKSQELSISFDIASFQNEFMNFIRSEGRFSYTPLILVEGVKK